MGKIPLKEWSSPDSPQKSSKCSTWLQSQKWQNDLSSFPREAIHHHSKSMPQPLCWRSWSWVILWRLTRPPRRNTNKGVLFIRGNWNAKVGSQEIPDRQVWSWSTKWSKAKVNRVMQREHTGHSKHSQQHKRWLYTWTSSHGQYRN